MKKFLLVAITLLPTLLTAQNGITITNFVVSAGTITFNISWEESGMPTLWRDSVWVFVDYNKSGVMTRLPIDISAGATLTALNGGSIEFAPDNNDKGVWVIGNARTESSFSATVALPYSVLAVPNVNGACAYASNYPPLGTWNGNMGELTIVGTPPYTLTVQSSTETKTVTSGSPFLLPTDYTLVSFTDATGAPGVIPPTAPESLTTSAATICGGVSVTLTAIGGDDGTGARFEWGAGTVGENILGTSTVTTYSVAPTVTTTYWVRRVSTAGYGATAAATATIMANDLPTAPVVAAATFCYNYTGELKATAAGGNVVEWYNAATEGILLYTGEVYVLSPLYSNTATYYAQAVSAENCRSALRTEAVYAALNCEISGECPGYIGGNIGAEGAESSAVACASNYPGQIGSSESSSSSSVCISHSPGRIGEGTVECDPPTAPTSFTASADTVCMGAPVVLTATGGSSGEGALFEWGTGTEGFGVTIQTTDTTYSASLDVTTSYWVRRVSTVNCGTSAAVALTIAARYCPGQEASACSGYTAGQVSAADAPPAGTCMSHYAGLIGATATVPACAVHYPGRIGQ